MTTELDQHNLSGSPLGVGALVVITVTAMLNLRNVPIMAATGLSCITYYLLAAATFLIPSSYVCSRLAATYPEDGGLYAWVSRAFGPSVGFFTIWFEWLNNVIAFPATCLFISSLVLHLDPLKSVSNTSVLLFSCAIMITLSALHIGGIKRATWVNWIGAIFGLLLPIGCLVALAGYRVANGDPSLLAQSNQHLLPDMNVHGWAPFIVALSGYSGMQITAFHARHVHAPAKTFPLALTIACTAIIVLSIGGTLAVASVIPDDASQLLTSISASVQHLLGTPELSWLIKPMLLSIAIGISASLFAWIIGPAQGLAASARAGHLPAFFAARFGRDGAPVKLLALQCVIACAMILFLSSMFKSTMVFWILVVQTSQFTMLTLILLFASAIKIHNKNNKLGCDTRRPTCFNQTIWLVCALPIAACTFALIVSFFPPTSLQIEHEITFECLLLLANGIYISIPFIIRRFFRP